MSISPEQLETILVIVDHLRAERDEARAELAEVRYESQTRQDELTEWHAEITRLRKELAELKAREHTPAWELAQTARRYKRERDDARAAGEVLMRDKARDTAPALAGDALREALTEALGKAANDYGFSPMPPAVKSYGEYLATAIMPIVGRAALAARSAFPARPFTMDHTFGYAPVPAEPCQCCASGLDQVLRSNSSNVECGTCGHYAIDHTAVDTERELRIQRTAEPASWRNAYFRGTCTHCSWWRRADNPDDIENAFVSHACVNYPLTDENEGQ